MSYEDPFWVLAGSVKKSGVYPYDNLDIPLLRAFRGPPLNGIVSFPSMSNYRNLEQLHNTHQQLFWLKLRSDRCESEVNYAQIQGI